MYLCVRALACVSMALDGRWYWCAYVDLRVCFSLSSVSSVRVSPYVCLFDYLSNSILAYACNTARIYNTHPHTRSHYFLLTVCLSCYQSYCGERRSCCVSQHVRMVPNREMCTVSASSYRNCLCGESRTSQNKTTWRSTVGARRSVITSEVFEIN